MGRYTGPICRLCRREGIKLCDKHKCAGVKRAFPPGMHGNKRQGKPSDYAKQLREKQKARRIFGISEKQIVKYFKKATSGTLESGVQLLKQMEHRFDNTVFRAGFATTRRQARQLVTHGVLMLNGKRVTIPSLQVKSGDTFTVRPRNKAMPLFEDAVKRKVTPPQWIKVDMSALTGQVIAEAGKEDVEAAIDPQMIIEFYSM